MTEVIILRGLPGSGKSTWAKRWVAQDPANRVRVNRDDLRYASFGKYTGVDEAFRQGRPRSKERGDMIYHDILAGRRPKGRRFPTTKVLDSGEADIESEESA